MPDQEMVKTLFNYGVPAGLLAGLVFALYRLALSAGTFLAPLIQELAGRHVKTMETFEVVGKGLLQQQEAQTSLMQRHDTAIADHGNKIDAIHEIVVKKNGKP